MIKELQELGLKVGWGTILIGWNWTTRGLGLVGPDEIRDFALQELQRPGSSANQEAITELIGLRDDESERIGQIIRQIARTEIYDPTIETRKWRLLLLHNLLRRLPPDPIYGLTGLTEFWQDCGFPEDSPHIVQGRDNAIDPFEYYTETNYQEVLDKHRGWEILELESLRGRERDSG
jgi:Uncharacterized protein conserved in bacteria (DUF2247)